MKSRYIEPLRDRKKILLIVTMLVIHFAHGNTQDYQSVRSDRVAYFEDSQHIVKCTKIDSVEQLSVHDSVFYLFPNLREHNNGCIFEGPSWMGNKIIIQDNGHTLFFNREHDTILIQTQALKNASWKAFQFEDSSYVMAEVTDHNTLSFLGQTDSVKTIAFVYHNKQGEPVDHALNDMTLQLSKSYGLIKTFNFNLFPESEPDIFNEQLRELDLIGLSKPEIGVNNLTWLAVHDHEIGDVLHIKQEFESYLPYCADNDRFSQIKLTIIGKNPLENGYKYRVDRIRYDFSSSDYTNLITHSHDTTTILVTPNPEFEKLPGEVYRQDDMVYVNRMNNSNFLTKTFQDIELQHTGDSCYEEPIDYDACHSLQIYYKGLGGPYYSCSGSTVSCPFEKRRELVYFKKDNESWGEPLSIQDNTLDFSKDIVHIFTDPVNNHLYIQVAPHLLPLKFELIDINGKVVLQDNIISQTQVFSLAGYDPGIYICKLRNPQIPVKTGKILLK